LFGCLIVWLFGILEYNIVMGSDLSSVQTHRQNRFDNHVVYNSNNNVGNN